MGRYLYLEGPKIKNRKTDMNEYAAYLAQLIPEKDSLKIVKTAATA